MADLQTSTLSTSIYMNCAEYCYDVFINHRGPDVKKTFASHLYYRLRLHGLQPFLDREELQAGELLSPQIEAAIRTASIHITIFSPGYADSRWCLDELVFILNKSGDTIIPVFYDVKPSELRWSGRYIEALGNHEQKGRCNRQTLEKWRKALFDVSYIIGFELQGYNGDEGKLLEEVVQCVLKKGRKKGLNVATDPAGLQENVEDFEITVLLQQKGKAKVLASVGRGELSKTTQAKRVLNGESSTFVHGQVEKVTFQRETLLAATENFNDDKGCDCVKFEGGLEKIKPSVASRMYIWTKRFIQRGLDDADTVICNRKTLLRVTQNFDRCNQVGEGGFGEGTSQDGREIAVKKLSRMFRPGKRGFLDKVKALTKIQHGNLVNLPGGCAEGSELLNQSLDRILFDSSKIRAFNLHEMMVATENFSREIGRGGFGTVFFGTLPEGKAVAVKVLSMFSRQGIEEFSNEVNLLSKVHHRNLISLLGYCDETRRIMLIYGYTSGGSLKDHLHGPRAENSDLNWKRRLKIALDAAQGLEYLHVGCTQKIIHRDIKTANILLDSNLNGKLGDFGLSKTIIDGEAALATTAVKGTFGYLDPEYYYTQMLTEKSDVYSFGVVLLEIICGRPPIDMKLPEEEINIIRWVTPYLQEMDGNAGTIIEIIDKRLFGGYDLKSVTIVAKIAMRCVHAKPSSRPRVSEIVAELKQAMNHEGKDSISILEESSGLLASPVESTNDADTPLRDLPKLKHIKQD